MADATAPAPGTRLRFTAPLGALHPTDPNAELLVLKAGQEGIYGGPWPTPDLARRGWHLTHVVGDGGVVWDCPAQLSQFEVVTTEAVT